jgi:tRNA (cmo5U34)-methyltransferase
LHDAFRRENGYTDLEISQKRSALENVLACDGIAAHEQRLYRAGFRHVVCWFRVANFASWLAFV